MDFPRTRSSPRRAPMASAFGESKREATSNNVFGNMLHALIRLKRFPEKRRKEKQDASIAFFVPKDKRFFSSSVVERMAVNH